jgi:hypothetical protein
LLKDVGGGRSTSYSLAPIKQARKER